VVFSGRPPWWQALRKTGLFVTLLAAILVISSVQARAQAPEPVALAHLPVDAQATYRLILAGGPFPHPKDGIVFGNRERALPLERRGFYHEYTVNTPGTRVRGARRIVCGGLQTTNPKACFYTADHYVSFQQIVQ
jgi:ribonuclease T1